VTPPARCPRPGLTSPRCQPRSGSRRRPPSPTSKSESVPPGLFVHGCGLCC
jgi:hypothetical protein